MFSVLVLVGQDAIYESLQSVVDWFREAVGIPMEKKYNTVLFGGALDFHIQNSLCRALLLVTL